jgi:hypothetical protein
VRDPATEVAPIFGSFAPLRGMSAALRWTRDRTDMLAKENRPVAVTTRFLASIHL